MATLPPEARELLESDALVHLVTLNPDGSPQLSCVWVGLDGDEIVSGHMLRRRKVRNVERDPRVVLSIEGKGLNELGLREYLVVHGSARVQEGGAAELLQRLAHVYLGPDVEFPPPGYDAPGYVLRITPERVGGVGPWTARRLRQRAPRGRLSRALSRSDPTGAWLPPVVQGSHHRS